MAAVDGFSQDGVERAPQWDPPPCWPRRRQPGVCGPTCRLIGGRPPVQSPRRAPAGTPARPEPARLPWVSRPLPPDRTGFRRGPGRLNLGLPASAPPGAWLPAIWPRPRLAPPVRLTVPARLTAHDSGLRLGLTALAALSPAPAVLAASMASLRLRSLANVALRQRPLRIRGGLVSRETAPALDGLADVQTRLWLAPIEFLCHQARTRYLAAALCHCHARLQFSAALMFASRRSASPRASSRLAVGWPWARHGDLPEAGSTVGGLEGVSGPPN